MAWASVVRRGSGVLRAAVWKLPLPPSAIIRCTSSAQEPSLMVRQGYAAPGPLGSHLRTPPRNARAFSSAAETGSERDELEYDVCIVGGGPAGLAAAIRLRQLCEQRGTDLSVCVLEKGAEVGSHILSGNVFEPRALDELIPDWREKGAPVGAQVKEDRFYFMTETQAVRLPIPPAMANHGNHIISLSEMVRWLGEQAEEAGADVFPGFAASNLLFGPEGEVAGIGTNDFGIGKDGAAKPTFQPGLDLQARVTLLAEGCRGSLSQLAMEKFGLREGAQPQTYALGIKEVWEVSESQHREGLAWHSVGWPLESDTYGGSFVYHMTGNKVAIGLVVALDYKNPYLSPYQEFQRFKQHPMVRATLLGGTCLEYGARSLNEGGLQSIPKLNFPGGSLIGCSAGFLNVPKIKGTHTAMKSGMLAAESAFEALCDEQAAGPVPVLLDSYPTTLRDSWVWEELHQARNIRPGFSKFGMWGGLANAALDAYVFRGMAPWTLRHPRPDHEATESASGHQPIEYPKPDGTLSFDILTSVYLSGTNHDHDQPPHLKIQDESVPASINHAEFAGLEERFCPARVYEYTRNDETGGEPELQINAQNCLHCKACDIKDPTQNIKWTVPEGGGGPSYSVM